TATSMWPSGASRTRLCSWATATAPSKAQCIIMPAPHRRSRRGASSATAPITWWSRTRPPVSWAWFLGKAAPPSTTCRYPPAAGRAPIGVAVGYLIVDGRDDIVVTNTFANQASVLLSNGDGTFQSPVPYTVGTNPTAVAVGNFTSSGHRDLVVANTGGLSELL